MAKPENSNENEKMEKAWDVIRNSPGSYPTYSRDSGAARTCPAASMHTAHTASRPPLRRSRPRSSPRFPAP